jgi:hypothetical protein
VLRAAAGWIRAPSGRRPGDRAHGVRGRKTTPAVVGCQSRIWRIQRPCGCTLRRLAARANPPKTPAGPGQGRGGGSGGPAMLIGRCKIRLTELENGARSREGHCLSLCAQAAVEAEISEGRLGQAPAVVGAGQVTRGRVFLAAGVHLQELGALFLHSDAISYALIVRTSLLVSAHVHGGFRRCETFFRRLLPYPRGISPCSLKAGTGRSA